ncbi:hypothetical protein PDESU_03830 [Pontiella desulfatans]|uniref:DUF1501 domain-containing protein n=1 Tax=Pontiella desulfatans TaxID=2750659 RepID=A0A6C2U5A5_PONDE|nr:DUF1501 domain-containing protein [Pontiella desulfatans]VGO15248.1 hypothetical protein PDESU_03830 [Pontiella desulfatans]
MKMNRREFTYLTAWGGAIGMASRTTFGAPDTKAPILVVIQLAGGNDGLNTVVPINNDHYYTARPKIAIKPSDAIAIDGATGLHPNLTGLKAIHDEGQLAIVEGVGYPNPNRSHFRSTEIWHTGSDSKTFEKHGWIGRYFDTYCKESPASIGLCIGKQNPQAFTAAMPKGVTFNDPRELRVKKAKGSDAMMMQMMGMEEDGMEATAGESIGDLGGAVGNTSGLNPLEFLENTATEASISAKQIETILKRVKPETTFPGSRFAKELQVTAQLIRGEMPTGIYYLSRGGFDTHTNQSGSHMALMKEIGDGLQAFHAEMKAAGLSNRVCVLVYSEFGRRVKENASGGTDHGVAQPVFVMGGAVRGGRYGKRPSLAPDDLVKGDIAHTTDYRSVYATLLEKHMGVDSKPVLLGKYDTLNFI